MLKLLVVPLDKGKPNKNDISNFRPVSILNTFSKIYELVIKEQITSELDKYLSPLVSAYRKSFNTQHVIIRMIEDWKEKLDNNCFVRAVLTDLSKAFDCIPHDLLIAKLAAYGLDEKSLLLIYFYLQNRQQCVRVNNSRSNFKNIISGVPQGSILGPLLFNCGFQKTI